MKTPAKTLTHQVFVMKMYHRDCQPSDRDFREVSPKKRPPYLPVRESGSVLFTDGDL